MEEKKEYKNKHMEEIKAFIKTYWKEMLMAAGVGIFTGKVIGRAFNGNGKSNKKNLFTNLPHWADQIDADIFTDLAPKIEEAILNKEVESAVINTTYDLDDLTQKVVTVTVETINGD